MKPEQERLSTVLKDTISLLCKNSLSFEKQVIVQGIIAITVDKEDVVVVQVNDYMGQPSYDPCVACGHCKDKPPEEKPAPSRKRPSSPCSEVGESPSKSRKSQPPSTATDDTGDSDRQESDGGEGADEAGEEEGGGEGNGGYELLPIKKEEYDGDDDDLVLIGEELKVNQPTATLTSGNYLDTDSSSSLSYQQHHQHDTSGNAGDSGYITGFMQNTQIMAVGSGGSQGNQTGDMSMSQGDMSGMSQGDMNMSPGSWTPGGSGDGAQQSTLPVITLPDGKFQCGYCERSYNHKHHCKRHITTIHLNTRQHVCRFCGKTFSRLDVLRVHVRSQHLAYMASQWAAGQSDPRQVLPGAVISEGRGVASTGDSESVEVAGDLNQGYDERTPTGGGDTGVQSKTAVIKSPR